MPVQDNGFLAAGAGDGSRSGESLQSAGISEAGAVITDLGEHPGAGQHPQAGEAGDDFGVRVVLKMGDRRLSKRVGGGAGGLELAQQRGQVNAHRLFHDRGLVQVGVGEDLPQPGDVAVEIAFAAGFDQQSAQPRRSQLGSVRRRRGADKMARASARASPPSGSSANAASAPG
jgi:hypothetical protein